MNFPKDIFKNLKVVEFASVLAGPAVGMFFAELGAEVIKIENRATGGDVTRTWKLMGEDPAQSISSYYAAINWGKESVFLDLKNADDLKVALDHIADADILISNFKSSSAEKMGLSYDQLKGKYPGLIYAQLDAFGPSSNRLAYDVILQAETGFLSMSGTPSGDLTKMPVALIDVLAAHQLKEGILVALYQKMSTGKGCMIRTSLFAAALASLVNQASGHLMAGHLPKPMGTMHPNIAPYGDVFISKDNKGMLLAIGSAPQFGKLCALLSIPNLAENPKFNTNQNRLENREELINILQEKMKTFEREKFLNECHALGIPAGAIYDMKEVFEQEGAKKYIIEELREGVKTKAIRSMVFEML